jgi:hypothetical protein
MTMSREDAVSEEKVDAYIEEVLSLVLIGFGSGIGSATTDDREKKPKLDIAVCAKLKDRYRANLKRLVVKDMRKFEDVWQYYLLMRSRQIGTKAARMMAELSLDMIDANLFEAAAVEVEQESKRTANRFRGLYGDKLDIACE